ncbi:MAG: aldehyde dehydrogenase family protein [Oscillospiraceae bacterium]|nr:aldehyde dehydrogenase family protein [Oscillospiraceae bacterium]
MSDQVKTPTEEVAELIARARAAQKIAEGFSQGQVDKLCAAIAYEITREENVLRLGKLAYEESQLGNEASKCGKLRKKIRGVWRDIKDAKSVGIIETNTEKGIVKFAKPVGVIGAIIPCTNPEATPVIKALNAIKCRNAIVYSPHPRTKKTNYEICECMRAVLKKYGAPEDLILTIEEPTMEGSAALMAQCDLVIATGGAGLVQAAYSSGTPAYGVGAGNAVVLVDETADLPKAAELIRISKIFDWATSCSSDNSLVVQSSIYDKFIPMLVAEGGYLCNEAQVKALEETMFPGGKFNTKVTARPAQEIAQMAGFEIPADRTFIIAPYDGFGRVEHPLSYEKLSIVLAVYKRDTLDEMIDCCNKIHEVAGKGHSCGIHTTNMDNALTLARKTYTSRVMVNQATSQANSGNWNNGMPFTLSLGCGTWGGNSASENITYKHYMNTTWVSFPIEEVVPSDEELFGEYFLD